MIRYQLGTYSRQSKLASVYAQWIVSSVPMGHCVRTRIVVEEAQIEFELSFGFLNNPFAKLLFLDGDIGPTTGSVGIPLSSVLGAAHLEGLDTQMRRLKG